MNKGIKRLEAELNKAWDVVELARFSFNSCDGRNVELLLHNLEILWDAFDVADSIEDIYKEALRNGR